MLPRLTVVASVALLLLSCGGGPTSPTPPTSPGSPTQQSGNTFTAVIDGVAFVATTVGARVVDLSGRPEEAYLEVHGSLGSLPANGTQVSIAVRPSVGTWAAGPAATGMIAVSVNNVAKTYGTVVNGGSGWVTVASINTTGASKSASGTFAFVAPAYDGSGARKSVTNGTFRVAF